MREFYLYGFKSREEYRQKSARAYDDEKRRVESWLGDYMRFVRTADGKNVFLSVDSRSSRHNPFYRSWKAKSFTDGDITLHFILMDLLWSPEVSLTLRELTERIDRDYLSNFKEPMLYDESTLRKKLKEYASFGIVEVEREGKHTRYRRKESTPLPDRAVLDFFSEVAPCGVIGSYLLDRYDPDGEEIFAFKHHYMTAAPDSNVTAVLLDAIHRHRIVTVSNLSRRANEPRENRVIPLRIMVSVQNGRQYLMAYQPDFKCIKSFRIDYLSNVRLCEITPRFAELRAQLEEMEQHMWGVNCRRNRFGRDRLEHVEFTLRIGANEGYILQRLEREKRIGRVEALGNGLYRFTADVYDTNELAPWIRSFTCRIVQMNFSNRTVENRIKYDLRRLCEMYGIEEAQGDDLQ
ncbi:MAG: WYL domain-containing protein [Ruminococcaceae bacterium]|nr:WYL domain-containing protein [Oscillospiraceae bacterium]